MKRMKAKVLISVDLRDYGALEDLISGLETEHSPEILDVTVGESVNGLAALKKQKPTRRKVSPADIERMISLHERGHPKHEIVRKTGWSAATVERALRGQIKPNAHRRKRVDERTVKIVKQLHKQNPKQSNVWLSDNLPDEVKIHASTVGCILAGKYDKLLEG